MSATSHWEDRNSRARDETHGDALMHLLLKQVALIPTEMYVYLYFIVYNVLWAQKAQLFRAREREDPGGTHGSSTPPVQTGALPPLLTDFVEPLQNT